MLTSSEYTEYCDTMSNTHAWGGQVELRALSRVLKKPIKVHLQIILLNIYGVVIQLWFRCL